MRIPTYRKHSSVQARVTIQGRDFLLCEHGYGKAITDIASSNVCSSCYGWFLSLTSAFLIDSNVFM